MILTTPVSLAPPPSSSKPQTTDHNSPDHLLHYLTKCTNMSHLKQIHAKTLRSTSLSHPHILFLFTRILYFSSLHELRYAHQVFDQITHRNSFSWNTLIGAYARSINNKEEAIRVYKRMLQEGLIFPDKHTFPLVLKACAYLFALSEGEQAHAQSLKLGLESDLYIGNSLIHFYASCGQLLYAKKVFDEMPERSLVSWNAMIDGFVRVGEFASALELFVESQGSFNPDGYTMQSVLNACGGYSALWLGMWAHAYVLRKSGEDAARDVLMGNSLVDMYCKCGSFDLALQVFERMTKRDLNSWNSIILGFSMHGKGCLALEYFECMTRIHRLEPNSITFVGVLSACNHCRMVSEGRKYFDLMVNKYMIEPQLEHFGCMVDMLARAGQIGEALDMVVEMPVKPDAVIWRSLLDACCKNNGGIELSEEMARQVLEAESGNCSGVYVLLSRVYASASRWNDVGLIRKLMADNGVTKEPGCTLIEIDGVTHEFFAGDTSHPQSEEIYRFLNVIDERLDSIGYMPDYSQAPMVDELKNGKQQSLRLHSERLAIALGLLSSKPGIPIRVFKNLKVCRDCHEVIKLISKLFNVEIIMRDRTRFHHFRDGFCSCVDYW